MTIRMAALVAALAMLGGLDVGSARVARADQTRQTPRATISGVVISTDTTPQPISRAVVTMTGGGILNNLSVVADEAGRFRFIDLLPGRYSIVVSKPAFLPMAYGATRPGRPGTSIAITGAENVDVRIGLPRGAVVTGAVRDQFGQPVPGVQVAVVRADTVTGQGGFRPSNEFALTDDRGVYRLYGLMPDEYVVSVIASRFSSMGETHSFTRGEIDARLRSLESSAAGANAGGVASVDSATGPSATVSYAPTYYPGTSIASNAIRIRVGAGEERSGIDIPLIPMRAARVSGTMLGIGGIDQRITSPMLMPLGPVQPVISLPSMSGIRPDGTFLFTNVAPGRYSLVARTAPSAAGGPFHFGATELTVDGYDISDVTVSLRPAPALSGRVVFDATTMKPPENLEILRVMFVPAGPGNAPNTLNLAGTAPSAWVRPDGTFRIGGFTLGTFSANLLFGKWWLRSVVVKGRDILDFPLEVDTTTEEMTDVVVTMSDRRAELHGALTTASGQPASEFVVVVYPAERDMWRPGARRIKSVRPGSDGLFSVTDLPAGNYLIAAITDADPNEWQQPSFLDQLVSASVKVSVPEGQRVRQDLRIAR